MSALYSNSRSRGKLWLALRLPDLPAHALFLDVNSSEPIVVSHKRQLIWMNKAAATAGVTLTMNATSAQLLSGCSLHERDDNKEQKNLAALAEGLYQFSPYIETYVSEHISQCGVLMEISSCLLLFGGLQSLSYKIEHFMTEQGITLVMGFAHSPAAAWLLSFEKCASFDDFMSGDDLMLGNGHKSADNKEKNYFIDRIKQLPIRFLYDFPQQVDALAKTGFVNLADIARQIEAQSISSFRKRFGHTFADYLCELFGIDHNFQQAALFEKPVTQYQPITFFSEQLQFDYPLHQIDQLQTPMENLLQTLSEYLRKRQLQTQHVEWVLADIYHNRDVLHIYADSPQHHWKLLYELSLIQVENRELPFEVDMLELNCRETMPMQARNRHLDFVLDNQVNRQEFSITAAKLKARLGEKSVYKLSYQDGYLPEKTNQHIGLTEKCQQQLPVIHQAAQRPAWLLDMPEEIEQRTQGLYWRGRITLITGPERIQGQWWNLPSARDYFIALRHDQQRLWVFWDLHKQRWFVQGIFA